MRHIASRFPPTDNYVLLHHSDTAKCLLLSVFHIESTFVHPWPYLPLQDLSLAQTQVHTSWHQEPDRQNPVRRQNQPFFPKKDKTLYNEILPIEHHWYASPTMQLPALPMKNHNLRKVPDSIIPRDENLPDRPDDCRKEPHAMPIDTPHEANAALQTQKTNIALFPTLVSKVPLHPDKLHGQPDINHPQPSPSSQASAHHQFPSIVPDRYYAFHHYKTMQYNRLQN